MKLDKHPKAMVFIMSALGVFVIGVVLTLAFFDNTTLLGVGVAMAVIGGAGAILGCINLMARRTDDLGEAGPGPEPGGIAPPRIPPPKELYYGESYGEANQHGSALYYEPCTSSPARSRLARGGGDGERDFDGVATGDDDATSRGFFDPNNVAASGIIYVSPGKRASAAANFPLSPLDRRSYPVPSSLIGSPMPQTEGNRVHRTEAVGRSFNANDSVLDATRDVDPLSMSRMSGAHPPRQSGTYSVNMSGAPAVPVQQGMVRRAPFQLQTDDIVGQRTPSRGYGGEMQDVTRWSPQN